VSRTCQSSLLPNDWTYTTSKNNGPDQESDTSSGTSISLHGEEVSHGLWSAINEGQRTKTEEEETQKLESCGARVWNTVMDSNVQVRTKDSLEHKANTLRTNPSLDRVPDNSHDDSIDNRPDGAKSTER
jgi:hypothetical protein